LTKVVYTPAKGKYVYRILTAMMWGAIAAASLVCNATAAPVTSNATGGVWTLSHLSATEGTTHHLQATLKPVAAGSAASVSTAQARPDTPSDAVSYAVDSKPPTIKRIFPSGSKIDPSKPYAIYEMQDNPGGSGVDLSKADNIKVDINAPTGLHPKASWLFSLKNGLPVIKMTVHFPDTTTLAGESYTFNITTKDRVGNTARLTGDRFTGSSVKLDPLVNVRGSLCLFDVGVAPSVDFYSSDNGTIIKGKMNSAGLDVVTAASWGTPTGNWGLGLSSRILDATHVSITGPAKLVSRVSSGLHKGLTFQRVQGNSVIWRGTEKVTSRTSNPYMRSFSLQALGQARNGDVVTVTVDAPAYGKIAYTAPTGSICKETLSKSAGRGQGGARLSYIGGTYIRDFNTPIQFSSARLRKSFQFRILVKAPPPKGKFVYDSKARTLDFIITDAPPIQFDTVQSRASLNSDTGYAARTGMKQLDSGKFGYRFKKVTEGRYKVAANVRSDTLFNINGTTGTEVQLTDYYTVRAAPPTIRSFRYDYQKKQLLMSADDVGTPRDRLFGNLTVDGNRYSVFFDSNGKASLPLPQPPTSATASLQVFDLAGQRGSGSRRILGTRIYDPASPPEQTTAGKTSASRDPQYVPVGGMQHGRKQYRKTCSSLVSYRFPSQDQSRGSDVLSFSRPVTISERWAEARRKARTMLGIGASAAKLEDITRKLFNNQLNVPHLSGPSWAGCGQTVWMDKFAPNIRNFRVDPASGTFSALIDDNGGPLNTLNVGYSLYADRKAAPFISKSNVVNREFNPRTGLLQGTFPVDPARERLKMIIGVTDLSGNNTSAKKTITTPYAPPDIKLTHTALNDSADTVLLFAEMFDRSGIDTALTSLSVDGAPCHATALAYGGFGMYSTGDRKWFCRATLAEGSHIFTAKGSDMLGLTAQASDPFTLSYKPRISRFNINSSAPSTEKGSVFSASIQDRGHDVGLSGIRLNIDGTPVPASQYVFDTKSGYFSADGPMAIASGFHRALLDVTDSHGNADQATLSFSRGAGAVSVLGQGAGELRFDRISLWELQNSNGDGDANPGELVRLYFSFANTGKAVLKNLKVTVAINDISVKIENPVFGIPAIQPGAVETGLQGIDVRIAPDILTRENLNQKTLPVDIQVTDGSGKHRQFAASLVVRELRQSFANKPPRNLSTPAAPTANIQPILVINNPVSGVVFKTGIDTMTGTFDPTDSTVASLTATLDGSPVPVQDLGGGVFNILTLLLPDGPHVLTVTLTTADGDSVTRTIAFTSKLIA